MIKLTKINKRYYISPREEKIIFKNMSFESAGSKMLAISGKSGTGKSTFLNIMAGMDLQYQGNYYFDNNIVDKKHMNKLRFNSFGYITQQTQLLLDRTIYENVRLALLDRGLEKNDIKDKIECTLEELGIYHLKKKKPKGLSGGEAQRVSIARAIIHTPSIILADEPTSALDKDSEKIILKKFDDLKGNGALIILVTHSMDVADACDDKFSVENNTLVKL